MSFNTIRSFAPDSFIFNVTNGTGSDIAGKMPIPFAGGFAIALNPIADNATGVAYTAVEATLPAASADDWSAGDTLYWDATAGELTDDADGGSNTAIGRATAAKLATETKATVFVPPPAAS